MSGVVAAGISRHDRIVLGKHIDDFAFTFVAPLGSDDYR
jgi:hypothetical protein